MSGRTSLRSVWLSAVATAFLNAFFPSLSHAATPLSGNLPALLALSQSPFVVIDTVTVPSGQTTTVEPGVTIKMAPRVSWIVSGTLKAAGTSTQPISITSLADDSIGGDTGNDGPTSGRPGDWSWMDFTNSSTSQLAYVQIRFGSMVRLTNSSPRLDNVSIQSAQQYAIHLDQTSLPQGQAVQAAGCDINGLVIDSPHRITTGVTWVDLGIPYVILKTRVQVDVGGQLTFAPGVVVKNKESTFAATFGGTFITQGTAAQPVTLTSLEDDTNGGDTNNDGNTTALSPGQWGGFQFIQTVNPSISHLIIRGAGLGPWMDSSGVDYGIQYMGAFDLHLSTVSVADSDISRSDLAAFSLDGGGLDVVRTTATATSRGSYVRGGTARFTDLTLRNQNVGLEVSPAGTAIVRGSLIDQADWAIFSYDPSASIDIDGTLIQNASVMGILSEGSLVITGSTVKSTNGVPIDFNPNQPFDFSGTALLGNSPNAVTITNKLQNNRSTGVTRPVRFRDFGFPYLLNGDGYGLNFTQGVSFDPGVVFKINNDAIWGTGLDINAFGQKPVVITSFADDSAGGDTNGDGNATAPSSNDWTDIFIYGPASPLTVSNLDVRYGALGFANATVDISSCSFHYSVNENALTLIGSNVNVTSSTFVGNGTGIYVGITSRGNIHYSSFKSQLFNAVANGDPYILDARWNYWGSATGPSSFHNPSGKGDAVTDGVLYTPFLLSPNGPISTAPPDILPPVSTLAFWPQRSYSPPIIGPMDYLRLEAFDDRQIVGDQQGVGIAQSYYSINSGSFTAYGSTFTLVVGGANTVQYYSTDLLGHQETAKQQIVRLDNAPPMTTISFYPASWVSPTSGKVYVKSGTQIFLVGQDALSGTRYTNYSIDGPPFLSYSGWFYLITGGSHSISAFSVDAVGNSESPPQVFSLYVDTSPPVSAISIVPQVSRGPGGEVGILPNSVISITGTDIAGVASSGLQGFYVSIDSGSFVAYSSTFSITTPGQHSIEWYSYDFVNNNEVVHSTTVFLSTGTPPTTTLSYGSPFYLDISSGIFVSSTTPLGFSVDDRGFPPVTTYFRVDSSTISFQTYMSTFTLHEGAHFIEAYSVGPLGNAELIQTFQVTVDTTPPVLQLVFAPNAAIDPSGQIVIDTQTVVTLQTTDLQSGIQNVLLRVNVSTDTPAQPYPGPFSLPAGLHQLQFEASDKLGFSRATLPFTVTVSTNNPGNGGNSDPSVIELPDGTPVVISPNPVNVAPPGAGVPGVISARFTPNPVALGYFQVQVTFSAPMDRSAIPQISFRPQGSTQSYPMGSIGYSQSDTLFADFRIPKAIPQGPASLLISGAKTAGGQTLSPFVFPFTIYYPLPPVPTGFSAQDTGGGTVRLSWNVTVGAFYTYNLYRSSHPMTGTAGLVPIFRTATGSAFDHPSADDPALYYALSANDPPGAESALTPSQAVVLPLKPMVNSPANGATVNGSSITLNGNAQPNCTIEVSLAVSSVTVGQTSVATNGAFAVPLTLAPGFQSLAVRARSLATGQQSVAVPWGLTVIAAPIPAPPSNLLATAGDTQVTLQWTASPSASTSGYQIYRNGSHRPANGIPLPATQLSWTDLALENGKSFSYVVTAVNATGGESAATPTVQALPVPGGQW